MKDSLHKHIVLTALNGLSFAGTFREVLITADGLECAVVELDRDSGFAIACPVAFIKEILVVPIAVAATPSRPGRLASGSTPC